MPSELDRRFDAKVAALTGPGGALVLDRDAQGRTILGNFPPTLPEFFRVFCELYAGREAVVAGNERLTFADLDRVSDRLALGIAAHGVAKGDRVAIAMRNCPAWIVSYMAILKAGGIATLINGWWEAHEMEHALELTKPKLVLADIARAFRISPSCPECEVVDLADRAAGRRGRRCPARKGGRGLHSRNFSRGRRDASLHLRFDGQLQGRRFRPTGR